MLQTVNSQSIDSLASPLLPNVKQKSTSMKLVVIWCPNDKCMSQLNLTEMPYLWVEREKVTESACHRESDMQILWLAGAGRNQISCAAHDRQNRNTSTCIPILLGIHRDNNKWERKKEKTTTKKGTYKTKRTLHKWA